MNNMQYYQAMGYPSHSPIADHPMECLESMYPEIYHRVHPKVVHMCMMMDHPHNPDMYPCPRREAVEGMADNIYMETMMEMNGDCRNWGTMYQQTPGFGGGFGRGGFLRDLITILLIRQLLFRRGGRF